MSLLDVDKLELVLSPELLQHIYGIGVMFDKNIKYSKQYLHSTSAFIEVWYPGPYYGCLWRYAGYQLTNTIVYIQFLDFPGQDWSIRSDLCFEGLNIEEFDMLYKALAKNDLDTLYLLHDHKPFRPEKLSINH